MKKILVLFATILMMNCTTSSQKSDPGIYVLGSIHGNMLNQPQNSLRDFVAALHFYKPTLILSEARSEFPSPIEAIIDGSPEQSLVYAFANQSKIKVMPVDWHSYHYLIDSAKEDSRVTKALRKKIEPLFTQFRRVVQTGSFEESQSSETQALIRQRYDLLSDHGIDSLRKRGSHICQNIKKLNFQGERVLIVFGLAHKYFLDDCVRTMGLQPMTTKGWFEANNARDFVPSNVLKEEAIQTFRQAKDLLATRLRNGYYKSNLDNFKEKLVELDEWILRTREL